ncbi:MAG: hypothetical protein KF763_01230 [Cyclobacteriaceae bacterium]|nr:hypothetical protein [Cyclobacteriaceae bacterium]
MDRKCKVLIVVVITVIFFSCSLTNRRNFNTYKSKPFDEAKSYQNIEGIYFRKSESRNPIGLPTFFYLFRDGSAECAWGSKLNMVPEKDFWLKPDLYLQNLNMSTISSAGHFYVRDSIVTIQVFKFMNPGGLFPTESIGLCGYIVNDSTFRLIETICDDEYKNKLTSGEKLPFKEQEYRLFQTTIKPDSSKIWFKRKRWYKKYVWYNQK